MLQLFSPCKAVEKDLTSLSGPKAMCSPWMPPRCALEVQPTIKIIVPWKCWWNKSLLKTMPSLVKFPTSFNDRLGLLGVSLGECKPTLWENMFFSSRLKEIKVRKAGCLVKGTLFPKNPLLGQKLWWKLQIPPRCQGSEVDQRIEFALIPVNSNQKDITLQCFLELVVNLCEEVPHFIINTWGWSRWRWSISKLRCNLHRQYPPSDPFGNLHWNFPPYIQNHLNLL